MTSNRKFTRATEPHGHVPVTEKDLDPSQLADLLELGSDPITGFVKAAEQLGLSAVVTKRMLKRIKAEHQPVLSELQEVKTSQILKLLEDRAQRALLYMDDYALSKSSAKDLAVIAGIMLEKRALLRGEPTQILSIEDRNNMNELLPKLLQEAQKRGMFVDMIDGMVDVTPSQDRAREYRPRGKTSLSDRKAKIAQARRDDEGDPT